MIMTATELRDYISTDLTDAQLKTRLTAVEIAIRQFTNNNFQNRKIRVSSEIVDGVITAPSIYFQTGDTLEISQSDLNEGLFVLQNDGTLDPTPYDCENNLITKVEYPADIKQGVANMIDWDINNRDKVGIASETISRHSVTYFNMDEDNSSIGYPKALTGFLKQYMNARF